MNRILACSAIFAASALLTLAGCGGGSGETPTTTATTPPVTTQPGATPPSTVEGKADEEAAPLLAWAGVKEGSKEEGPAPLTVEFEADIEGGTPPLKYVWKFGDGSESTEKNPKHTYEKPGKYRADLEVSDSGGDSDSDYVEIEVQ
jgi:PKD repeat protein